MRVLVTGAGGFVGSALVRQLVAAGHKVCAIIRNPDTKRSGLNRIEHPALKYSVVGDVNAQTNWADSIEGAEVVVHLAARVHVMRQRSPDPLSEYRSTNVFGTRRLAEAAVQASTRRFIFVSSAGVHGMATHNGQRFCETDEPRPHDAYTISKLEAELLLKELAVKSGMEYVILRPPLIYGPGNPGNFFRLIQFIDRGIPLPLASIRNDRSLIYLGNMVDAILICLSHPGAANKIYLVSDGEDISTPELITRLAHAMGKPTPLFPCPAVLLSFVGRLLGKTDEISRLLDSLAVDSSKIRSELGWKPSASLDQGLVETARWFLQTRAAPS